MTRRRRRGAAWWSRDSGPGVAPELAEEVFRHGFTTKAAEQGERGLGLALTRQTCLRRGGSVDGATARCSRRGCRVGLQRVIRVLVVDDDFMVAKVHSGYVARTAGFEVVGVAHTGADALRRSASCGRTWCCWTSTCRTWTGVSVLRALRAERRGHGRHRDHRGDRRRHRARGDARRRAALPDQAVHVRARCTTSCAHFAALHARLAGCRRPASPMWTRCSAPGPGSAAAEGPDAGDRCARRRTRCVGARTDLSAAECAARTRCRGSAHAATWNTS